MTTLPDEPSTMTYVPGASSRTPGQPTTAGMPRLRARIEVCEVGPPSWVANASTIDLSMSAVSAGARSIATRMLGSLSSGMPGAGTSSSRATVRLRMSSRSVTRAAKYSPSVSSTSRVAPNAS